MATHATLRVDARGIVVEASAGSRDLLGRPAADLGRPLTEWVPLEADEDSLALLHAAGEGRFPRVRLDLPNADARIEMTLFPAPAGDDYFAAIGPAPDARVSAGEFGRIAHDLNNPLAAIVGFADLLRSERSDARRARFAEIVGLQAERARKLVENVASYIGERVPDRKPNDLNARIRGMVGALRIHFELEDVAVDLALAPDLPLLSADSVQLDLLVYNLLTTAEHRLAPAPAPRALRVATWLATSAVWIEVEDTGDAPASELRDALVAPFASTRGKGCSTALGLCVAQRLVDNHGGTIDLTPRGDRGTRVRVCLPL